MQCQLCAVFYQSERVSEKVEIGKDSWITIINRLCPHVDKIVGAEDDGCEKFSPCLHFWCKGWESWVTIRECQARINKDKYKTCPCSVGVECTGIQIQAKVEQPKKQIVVRAPKKLIVMRKGG